MKSMPLGIVAVLLMLLGAVSQASACSVQLGRPDSCYNVTPNGVTVYGRASGRQGIVPNTLSGNPSYGAGYGYRGGYATPAPMYRQQNPHAINQQWRVYYAQLRNWHCEMAQWARGIGDYRLVGYHMQQCRGGGARHVYR